MLIVGFRLAALAAAAIGRTVSVGVTAAAVAWILSFVIIVDQPFDGETSVKPREIVKAPQVNSRRS